MAHPPSIMALPTTLVLLLHLHIMAYPHCNSPEYTPDLFSPRRPLRARTGTMEDIVAFLIEKIEGREKLKSILGGIYPCLQPSDSVGFRTAAAKYVETLRTSVIRPPPSATTSNGRTPSASTSSTITNSHSSRSKLGTSLEHDPHPAAWWWSAIVVRKSLLEECAGERFEKMLLALSTHALSVQIPKCDTLYFVLQKCLIQMLSASSLRPSNSSISTMPNELQDQAREYANLLSHASILHAQRLQAVTRLNARTEELLALRARLALAPKGDVGGPDTERILTIRDSKWHDLVDAWNTTFNGDQSLVKGDTNVSAEDALKWLIKMAGASDTTTTLSFASTPQHDVEIIRPSTLSPVQTLPTASAHHPANVHKLSSLPAFVSMHTQEFSIEGGRTQKSTALKELLGEHVSKQTQLRAALGAVTMEGEDLKMKLNVALRKSCHTNAIDSDGRDSLNLWDSGGLVGLDFEEPSTPPLEFREFLQDLSIVPSRGSKSDAERQQILEDRVLVLRNSLEPQIPSPAGYEDALEIEGPPIQLEQKHASKLPSAKQALAKTFSRPELSSPTKSARTPRTPRPYQTSTPPTKSRSRSPWKAASDLQSERLGVNETPLLGRNLYNLAKDSEQQGEEINSEDNDGLRTPTVPRGSIPLPVAQAASLQDEMIADMSLPDFSDRDITANGTMLSDESEPGEDFFHNGEINEDEDDEVPYEGHSVTLRDMLIKTGDGEDIFHLIGEDVDLEEGIGNETMGWG